MMIRDEKYLKIKENHVLGCFTDYLYHKHASDLIQEELDQIAAELSSGAPSTGIIKVSKDARNNSAAWENELIAREYELIEKQDKHIEAIVQVDKWLADIRSENHRKIIVEYLINNRCKNAEDVAKMCFTTKGNVSNVANRIVRILARKIS